MFRALLLLILISGTPSNADFAMQNQAINQNLMQVNNFQVMPNQNESATKTIELSAKSALAIDLDAQIVLYKNNSEQKLPIASLAKLMTALILLEEHDLHENVIISDEVNQVEGSRMWLYAGEQISVENLIKGMLINSGNDAAYELAKFNAGSLEMFSKKMNQKAFYLGLKNSSFLDPAGLDDENNYSTAQDLAIISKHILKNDFIRKIVAIRSTSVFSTNGRLEHKLKNTNKLLESLLQAKGLKTGTTEKAGECLITLAEIKNNDVLIIILGSEDRYTDTKQIYNYLQAIP